MSTACMYVWCLWASMCSIVISTTVIRTKMCFIDIWIYIMQSKECWLLVTIWWWWFLYHIEATFTVQIEHSYHVCVIEYWCLLYYGTKCCWNYCCNAHLKLLFYVIYYRTIKKATLKMQMEVKSITEIVTKLWWCTNIFLV